MLSRGKFAHKLTLGVVLAGSCVQVAFGNLIRNGSFEDGRYASAGGWQRVAANSTAIDFWTIGGVAVDWHQDFVSAHHGRRVIDLHLDGGFGQHGSISQAFETVIGKQYLLDFYLAGPGKEFGFPNPRRVRVNVAGNTLNFEAPASSHLSMNWFLQSATFIAVDTQTTLTFRSATDSTNFWGPVVDNVTVVATGVPEPSTFALSAALIGLIGLARRGRK
ncbi:MAG: choice-of-anchor C family protein [Acidobacteria bacterium]|nr:choice-of-anchor C family protein [Acidobacteriota bacterium]